MIEATQPEGGEMAAITDFNQVSPNIVILTSTHHWTWARVRRFEHGGFGGGGGNSRWVEESRDDGDWSKPTPRNERLEQWVIRWLTPNKEHGDNW